MKLNSNWIIYHLYTKPTLISQYIIYSYFKSHNFFCLGTLSFYFDTNDDSTHSSPLLHFCNSLIKILIVQVYEPPLITLSYLSQTCFTTHRQSSSPDITIFLTKNMPKTLVIGERFHMNTIKIIRLSFKENTTTTNFKSWIG